MKLQTWFVFSLSLNVTTISIMVHHLLVGSGGKGGGFVLLVLSCPVWIILPFVYITLFFGIVDRKQVVLLVVYFVYSSYETFLCLEKDKTMFAGARRGYFII